MKVSESASTNIDWQSSHLFSKVKEECSYKVLSECFDAETVKLFVSKYKVHEKAYAKTIQGQDFDSQTSKVDVPPPNTMNFVVYQFKRSLNSKKDQKLFKCLYTECCEENKVFTTFSKLCDHLRKHTGERPFLCTYDGCNYTFSQRGNLNNHIKETHLLDRPYKCPNADCDKMFSRSGNMKQHLTTCKWTKRQSQQRKDGDDSISM